MQDFIKTVKIIIFALVVTLGVNYVFAWTGPSEAPTGGNVPAPINVSASEQTKQGIFNLVNDFFVGGNAYIDQLLGIGTQSISTGTDPSPDGQALSLDVEGAVGASYYCDQDGNNCVAGDALGGGSDTLSNLSCSADQIAKWDGSAWVCATDETGGGGGLQLPTCNDGEIIKYNTSTSQWECAVLVSSSAGVQVFTEDGTFVVPDGVTEVTLTGIGGGGAGGTFEDDDYGVTYRPRGGYAGQLRVEQTVSVTPGESIPITIGQGGKGWKYVVNKIDSLYNKLPGARGGDTKFGSYMTFSGGAPAYWDSNFTAGQDSVFNGSGGNGAPYLFMVSALTICSSSPTLSNATAYGAGGGSCYNYSSSTVRPYTAGPYGHGKQGVLIVRWLNL